MLKTLKNNTKKRKVQAMREQKRKCWLCKGYGELKSYCDQPDRMCPECDGTGEC